MHIALRKAAVCSLSSHNRTYKIKQCAQGITDSSSRKSHFCISCTSCLNTFFMQAINRSWDMNMIMESISTSETLWGGFTNESSACQWLKSLCALRLSDDKTELKIKLESLWMWHWSSCTNVSSTASPCLSDDVLLHRCSTGRQSSTGPGAEAKREDTWRKKKKKSTARKGNISKVSVNSVKMSQEKLVIHHG